MIILVTVHNTSNEFFEKCCNFYVSGADAYTAKEFILMIDGIPAMRIDGIARALGCFFVSFYTFGASYPVKTYLLFEFIQR